MLINFLHIRDETHLSPEEARKIRLADAIEHSGLSEDEIRIAIEDAKRKSKIHPNPSWSPLTKISQRVDSPFIRDIARRRPSIQDTHSDGPQKDDSAAADRQSDESIDTDDYTPKTVDYGKKIDLVKTVMPVKLTVWSMSRRYMTRPTNYLVTVMAGFWLCWNLSA